MLKFPKCYFCKEFMDDRDAECCSKYPDGIPTEVLNTEADLPCYLLATKNEDVKGKEPEGKFSKRLLDIIGS